MERQVLQHVVPKSKNGAGITKLIGGSGSGRPIPRTPFLCNLMMQVASFDSTVNQDADKTEVRSRFGIAAVCVLGDVVSCLATRVNLELWEVVGASRMGSLALATSIRKDAKGTCRPWQDGL
eukprot:5009896-Amphidinium_carterae.1